MDKIWLVLNRADMRGGVPLADIEDRLRIKVRYRIPDDQPLATHSVNRGVPLAMSHADSRLARAMRGFARELATEAAGLEHAEDDAGLFGGIVGRLRGRPQASGA